MGRQHERASDGESASSSDFYAQNLEARDYGDELVSNAEAICGCCEGGGAWLELFSPRCASTHCK